MIGVYSDVISSLPFYCLHCGTVSTLNLNKTSWKRILCGELSNLIAQKSNKIWKFSPNFKDEKVRSGRCCCVVTRERKKSFPFDFHHSIPQSNFWFRPEHSWSVPWVHWTWSFLKACRPFLPACSTQLKFYFSPRANLTGWCGKTLAVIMQWLYWFDQCVI